MFILEKTDWKRSLPFALIYFLTATDALLQTCNSLAVLIAKPSTLAVEFPVTLSFFSHFNLQSTAIVLLLLNLTIPWMCFHYLNSQTLRIVNFLLFLVSKGFLFSVWRMEHVYWPLLWTLLFFALAPKSVFDDPDDRLSINCYRGALIAIVSSYFYPAMWKVIIGIQSGNLFDINTMSNTAANYLITHGKESFFGPNLVNSPNLSYIGLWISVLFQLSSILCLFSRKALKFWPMGAMIFHALNIFTLNINFLLAGIVVNIVMLYAPEGITLYRWRNKWTSVQIGAQNK